MKIDLVVSNKQKYSIPSKSFFENIFNKSSQILKIKHEKIELSLNFVGDKKIKALNNKHRHKNKVTDVLSFPLGDGTMSKYDIMPLGDIFICFPFVKKQSKLENKNLKDELSRLSVHGLLHLLGYDHEKSKNDADKMFRIESKILVSLNK